MWAAVAGADKPLQRMLLKVSVKSASSSVRVPAPEPVRAPPPAYAASSVIEKWYCAAETQARPAANSVVVKSSFVEGM